MDQFKTQPIQLAQTNTYCSKCLSLIDLINFKDYVKDHNGNIFCDDFCRGEYYAEINRDINSNFEEWVGRD